MKYGYHFCDGNLGGCDEILEIKELTEDFIDSAGHIFKKDDYCGVKLANPKNNQFFKGDISLYRKEYIFNTQEECNAYGKEHSSCFKF